jgi:hypothetical protein
MIANTMKRRSKMSENKTVSQEKVWMKYYDDCVVNSDIPHNGGPHVMHGMNNLPPGIQGLHRCGSFVLQDNSGFEDFPLPPDNREWYSRAYRFS